LSARTVFEPDHWDLAVVVAVADARQKHVKSSDGMRATRETSPYYQGWIDVAQDHLDGAMEAIASRDIVRLGIVAESSCLKMHASAMAADPPILYLAATTLRIIETVRGLRDEGLGCFYTVDAGPQVKVVCRKEDVERVREGVQAVPGVHAILVHSTGTGCRLV
jgi:diphosphomevalonate decarboxylase